jgi:hypothetical protein
MKSWARSAGSRLDAGAGTRDAGVDGDMGYDIFDLARFDGVIGRSAARQRYQLATVR